MSVLAVVGIVATWRLFVVSAVGQQVEAAALAGADYGQTTLWRVAEPVLDVVSTSFIALGAAVAVAVALARRRWALAVQATVLVAGANLTTQVLKWLIERPDLGPASYGNSLPSGHATVAASVAAAVLLVVPRRARPWVVLLGALYTAATGVSTLIGQWHRPSDVVAAVFVVLLWTALVCAATPDSALDPPGRAVSRGTALVAGGLGLVALAAFVPALGGLLAARDGILAGGEAGTVTTYVAGAAAVVAAVAFVFALMLVVRQSTARGVAD